MPTESIPGTLLLERATVDNPHPFYRRLVSEFPVWQVGDTDVFAISSFQMIEEATRRVDHFSSNLTYLLYRGENGLPARQRHGEKSPSVLAVADPPLHAAHKKVVSSFFSPHRIASLGPQVAGLTSRLVADALRRGETEAMSAIAHVIPISIISSLIGFKDSDHERLLSAALISSDILAGVISHETLLERLTLSREAGEWITGQLIQSLAEPREGILGYLANAVNEREIELSTGIGILHTLLTAGGESTASLIGNAIRMLAGDIELQQLVRADKSLIPNFVEEVLRLESPFRQHLRWVPKATTLGGVDIPSDSTLLLLWGAANRDPAKFDRPDELMLKRPRHHVAFGSGIHTCLGNTLARLEARVVVEVMLSLTDEISMDTSRPLVQVPSLLARRFEQLPVHLTPVQREIRFLS